MLMQLCEGRFLIVCEEDRSLFTQPQEGCGRSGSEVLNGVRRVVHCTRLVSHLYSRLISWWQSMRYRISLNVQRTQAHDNILDKLKLCQGVYGNGMLSCPLLPNGASPADSSEYRLTTSADSAQSAPAKPEEFLDKGQGNRKCRIV